MKVKKSDCDETYVIINKKPSSSLGAGARKLTENGIVFFIEITVKLCQKTSTVDLGRIENILKFLRDLEKEGFNLSCDDGCITCEKTVTKLSLEHECKRLSMILDRRC